MNKPVRASVLVILLFLSSCATMQSWLKPVARYSEHSYASFTSLKAELKAFVDTVGPETPDSTIGGFMLSLDRVYEYEAGKGLENHETVAQLELLRSRLVQFVAEARGRKLSEAYRGMRAETLARILDIVVSTEYAKPR